MHEFDVVVVGAGSAATGSPAAVPPVVGATPRVAQDLIGGNAAADAVGPGTETGLRLR